VNNKKGGKTPFFSYTSGCRGKGLWEYVQYNTLILNNLFVNVRIGVACMPTYAHILTHHYIQLYNTIYIALNSIYMNNTNLSPIEAYMLSIRDADTFVASLGPEIKEEDNSWIYEYEFPQ